MRRDAAVAILGLTGPPVGQLVGVRQRLADRRDQLLGGAAVFVAAAEAQVALQQLGQSAGGVELAGPARLVGGLAGQLEAHLRRRIVAAAQQVGRQRAERRGPVGAR